MRVSESMITIQLFAFCLRAPSMTRRYTYDEALSIAFEVSSVADLTMRRRGRPADLLIAVDSPLSNTLEDSLLIGEPTPRRV